MANKLKGRFGIPLLLILFNCTAMAQVKPYYYEIPPVPVNYSAETVMARMVDGLGFRYFWATEGLSDANLQFRPQDSARTILETLHHIYGLTTILRNTVDGSSTGGNSNMPNDFNSLRQSTLDNIQAASIKLKAEVVKIADLKMVFERPAGRQEYDFWFLINGPVEDALWHVGQVVSFRRSAGNPLPAGVNVLQGTKRN